jgi:hypothetical protein
MPSPTFGVRGVIVDAVAYAVREAWTVPDRAVRPRVVHAALRRLLGEAPGNRALDLGLAALALQPEAPAGDVEPPAIAALALCARCKRVKLKEERRPFRGKVRMEVLRDPAWMHRQFEQLRRSDRTSGAWCSRWRCGGGGTTSSRRSRTGPG